MFSKFQLKKYCKVLRFLIIYKLEHFLCHFLVTHLIFEWTYLQNLCNWIIAFTLDVAVLPYFIYLKHSRTSLFFLIYSVCALISSRVYSKNTFFILTMLIQMLFIIVSKKNLCKTHSQNHSSISLFQNAGVGCDFKN